MRSLICSFCLALLALAILPRGAAQQAVILVRHAEKISDDLNARDVPLSRAGEARARLLAEMLRDSGTTAIYASDTLRTRATAQPLARLLKLPIRNLDQRNPESAVRRLQKENPADVVLVVGHADTLPELLAAFGYRREVRIANDDYANLFVVIPRSGKPPSVLHLDYGEERGESDARRKNPAPRRTSPPGAP
jgi:broad specificity phosphatase PhoE